MLWSQNLVHRQFSWSNRISLKVMCIDFWSIGFPRRKFKHVQYSSKSIHISLNTNQYLLLLHLNHSWSWPEIKTGNNLVFATQTGLSHVSVSTSGQIVLANNCHFHVQRHNRLRCYHCIVAINLFMRAVWFFALEQNPRGALSKMKRVIGFIAKTVKMCVMWQNLIDGINFKI